MNKLNQPMLLNAQKDCGGVDIGQRVMIQSSNCTGRYIGDNEIIYFDKGQLRRKTIQEKTILDEGINKKDKNYLRYKKILERKY